jgi:hypothetical protein
LHPPGDAGSDSGDEYGLPMPVFGQAAHDYGRKLERMMEKWLIVQSFRDETRQTVHKGPDPEMGVRAFEQAVRSRIEQVLGSQEKRERFEAKDLTMNVFLATTGWLWFEYIFAYQTFLIQNHYRPQENWDTNVPELNKRLVFRPNYGGIISLFHENTLKQLHDTITHGIFVLVNFVIVLLMNNAFHHFGISLVIRLIFSL